MRIPVAFTLAVAATAPLFACGERSGSVPEIPEAELVADVPELDAVHEVMAPLWHEAFPAQDFEAIAEAVPQLAWVTLMPSR